MWIWSECGNPKLMRKHLAVHLWNLLHRKVCRPSLKRHIFIPEKISLSHRAWCRVSSTCCWWASDCSGDSGDLWRQAGTASPQASVALMWLPVGKLTLGTQEKPFSELVLQTGRLCWGFWEWRAISCLHRKKSYWKQICSPVGACDLDLCANR